MQRKMLTLAATVLLVFCFIGATTSQYARTQDKLAGAASKQQTMTTTQEPQLLVCNLGAMTLAERQRHDRIGQRLRHAAKQVKELPDGYAFQYASDPALFMAAAEFITLESRCCLFYQFSLEQEPREGKIWLRVTGPKEAKNLIKLVLAP